MTNGWAMSHTNISRTDPTQSKSVAPKPSIPPPSPEHESSDGLHGDLKATQDLDQTQSGVGCERDELENVAPIPTVSGSPNDQGGMHAKPMVESSVISPDQAGAGIEAAAPKKRSETIESTRCKMTSGGSRTSKRSERGPETHS